MRLVMDLQACQTGGSAHRGVGRYSRALFKSILTEVGQMDLRVLLGRNLAHDVDVFELPANRVMRLPALPNWCADRSFRGGEQDNLDAIAYSAYLSPINPDIIHVSHVFEGYNERVALPSRSKRPAGQLVSATLYDLIPLRFQEFYFQNLDFRKWYLARLNWLRQADLLLAISESSRRDAINLLGIEPWRVVTVHGGVSSHFCAPENPSVVKRELIERYKLRPRIVLYTGGDDHRKNIRGAILGYARVPVQIRRDCQLVIVCAMEAQRQQMYLDVAKNAGLGDGEVLITGFIPETDLVAFYQSCDVFVFPSLYEGLGLPVLEAMACGAPVIGGNNSSIRELISRPDALFDASSETAIGEAIVRVLSTRELVDDLQSFGIKRAKEFSWHRTAKLAIEAFCDASQRTRDCGAQVALHGWLPRRRLAILTPLPPCRSGIADYNAQFLPYLSRHFEIDIYVDDYEVNDESLKSSFRIFKIGDFEKICENYDVIFYEFGNSEFHCHMLPLLERFPGVVGLHDAYLSGLFGYLDFFLGNTGSYSQEMLAAHGPRAGRYFAPIRQNTDPNGSSMTALPCTKRVIDLAIGLISHSPFNLRVAEENYPEHWRAPYRIIPQMVPLVDSWTLQEKNDAMKALGFKPDDLVVATFGHIVWTKWGDRLFDAFSKSELATQTNVHLVFVGELAKDDFGRKLSKAIRQSSIKARIHITGFLDEDNYKKYLQISTVAVQLRTMSRGGTPKGVLDCLANGLPVIVNNSDSYRDYSDRVVYKLSPDPKSAEIVGALTLLLRDKDLRVRFASEGRNYVCEHHDPARCAAEYAAAIHEFVERNGQIESDHSAKEFAPHLAKCGDVSAALSAATNWLEAVPWPDFDRRRLFVDVSHIAQGDHGTGIQRVVKEMVCALYCSNRPGFEPIAVELVDGRLKPAITWLQGRGFISSHAGSPQTPIPPICFRPGDVLLMLDSSWGRYREFFEIFEEARRNRVPIYSVVYDLLPMRLAPGNFVDGGREWFTRWFHDAIDVSDGLISISKAVAEEVISEVDARPGLSRRPRVGYWHLGADFSSNSENSDLSPEITKLAKSKFLLMVGTIEPRKSHLLALDAMERLWDRGNELCLCIAGKEGWMVGDLIRRIRNHPQIGKKLFYLSSPGDSDIAYLYRQAAGLLFLSKGEGFGLPLIEAANYGTAILCSDIPVFREIAGNFATFINIEGADASLVAFDIEDWWRRSREGLLPDTRSMPRLTWEESGEALLDVVLNNQWLRGAL